MSHVTAAIAALFYTTLAVVTPIVGILFVPVFLVEEYAMIGTTLPAWTVISASLGIAAMGPVAWAIWITNPVPNE